MTANEIRAKFLRFFAERGHAIVPSASLVPENDPTTLFTGSGMQPMVPYLLGEKHPQGTRIADSQKSFRTGDIEEVGDNRHTTFFEMLGNWSFGDYFKQEQLEWMFKFLTEEIGLEPNKLYVTAFIGDEENNIPKDTESAEIWKKLFASKNIEAKEIDIGAEENGYQVGMQGGRIFYYDVSKNWWSRAGVPSKMPAGEPGGPDSEMFYEFVEVEHDVKFGPQCHPNCDCGRFIEIGNNVFMEYGKNADSKFSKLPQKNVDFGGGFERLVAVYHNTPDIFKTDLFTPIISKIEQLSGKKYETEENKKSFRIVSDHIRAATFLINDGVLPSNTDQGYFVRRLIRRAVRYADLLNLPAGELASLSGAVAQIYADHYPEVKNNLGFIQTEVKKEEERFRETLSKGLKEFEKGIDPFILFTTYGFPLELTKELAKEKGKDIDEDKFWADMKSHQDLSRAGAEQKFKGGLADNSEEVVKYHTATHLLNQALHEVLGDHVEQRGSNITAERLRFDFSHPAKMTDEEKQKVEEIVNEKIKANLPVKFEILPKAEAEKTGARHMFNEKYGDEVKVYYIGNSLETAYSKEFCGGPHVESTGVLGTFKITKEEAVAAGIRRIKATLG